MVSQRKFFEKGQGIVEYVLVTALVILAAIGIFRSFRQDLQEAYHRAGQQLIQGVTETSDASPSAGN